MAVGTVVIYLISVICVLSTFIFVCPARSSSILFISKNFCSLVFFIIFWFLIVFISALFFIFVLLFCFALILLIFFTFLSLKFRWICYFCSFFNSYICAIIFLSEQLYLHPTYFDMLYFHSGLCILFPLKISFWTMIIK